MKNSERIMVSLLFLSSTYLAKYYFEDSELAKALDEGMNIASKTVENISIPPVESNHVLKIEPTNKNKLPWAIRTLVGDHNKNGQNIEVILQKHEEGSTSRALRDTIKAARKADINQWLKVEKIIEQISQAGLLEDKIDCNMVNPDTTMGPNTIRVTGGKANNAFECQETKRSR